MAAKKVAVVTGSNKGIGLAIVRGLCKQYKGVVYLTARDTKRGQDAVAELEKEGLKPQFHQLDLTDAASITTFKSYLSSKYGGLDLLVNNAGIAYKSDSTAPFGEQAEVSKLTNYNGTLNVCNELFPLLRPHARVVNVSSMAAPWALSQCSDEVKQKFLSTKTVAELDTVLNEFVSASKAGNNKELGWPTTAYGTSKIGVTQMTVIHQKLMDADPREDIVINACCPGYVATDMSSYKGTKTIDEGAQTPLYLALLPENTTTPKGNHVSDKKIQPWG